MNAPSHISLAGRKALLARLLAYESRERNVGDLCTEATDRVVNEMILGGNQAMANPTAQPLDDWLREAVAKAHTITVASCGPNLDKPATEMLKDLAAQAAGLSCTICSKSKLICKGNLRDDSIVAHNGHCVRQVLEAFSSASAIAKNYYSTYARGFAGAPRLILSTSEEPKKPHDIPIAINIGGETRYGDDSYGPISTVELKIFIKSLDWESWLASLYLFLHELVCHAYAGIAPPHAGRKELMSFDPFAEGWMDRVCGMMLEDIVNNALPGSAPHIPFRNQQVDTGNRFRLQRQLPERDDGGKAWSVVQSARAAQKVFEALQRLPGTNAHAREAMYQLSLDLNLLDRPVEARAHLITVIQKSLTGQENAQYGAVIRFFNQYLSRKIDAGKLFTELSRL